MPQRLTISGHPVSRFCAVTNTLGRLHRLAELLRTGRRFTGTELARREETCPRTIARYMDFLCYSLEWEIERGRGVRGYRLIKEGTRLLNHSAPHAS